MLRFYRFASWFSAVIFALAIIGTEVNAQGIVAPDDVTIECGSSLDPVFTGTATATDDAGGSLEPSYEDNDDGLVGCGGTGYIVRTWEANSLLGQIVQDNQVISIVDTTVPDIDCPPSLDVACSTALPLPDNTSVSAADGCSSVTVSFGGDENEVNGDEITTYRTYVATDECGNSIECVQVITRDCTNDEVYLLGNYAWNDLNGNGLQDSGEPGIAGVIVSLYEVTPGISGADLLLVATTVTNADGFYSFYMEADVEYVIEFDAPSGYVPTAQNAGDDTLDSDIDSNGQTESFVHAADDEPQYDAGFVNNCEGFEVQENIICSVDGTSYILQLLILNGAAPYTIDGDIDGVYNIDAIYYGNRPTNTPYFAVITDAAGCTATISSGPFIECTTVAVELLSFDGQVEEGANVLNWTTASEDLESFILQLSVDGVNFETLGEVEGKGDISTGSTYTFADTNPQRGTSYYRLLERDNNGSINVISNVVELNRLDDIVTIDQVAPIPTSDILNVTLSATTAQLTDISVFNVLGQRLHSNTVRIDNVNEVYQIDVAAYPIGVYILSVRTGDHVENIEFVVTD